MILLGGRSHIETAISMGVGGSPRPKTPASTTTTTTSTLSANISLPVQIPAPIIVSIPITPSHSPSHSPSPSRSPTSSDNPISPSNSIHSLDYLFKSMDIASPQAFPVMAMAIPEHSYYKIVVASVVQDPKTIAMVMSGTAPKFEKSTKLSQLSHSSMQAIPPSNSIFSLCFDYDKKVVIDVPSSSSQHRLQVDSLSSSASSSMTIEKGIEEKEDVKLKCKIPKAVKKPRAPYGSRKRQRQEKEERGDDNGNQIQLKKQKSPRVDTSNSDFGGNGSGGGGIIPLLSVSETVKLPQYYKMTDGVKSTLAEAFESMRTRDQLGESLPDKILVSAQRIFQQCSFPRAKTVSTTVTRCYIILYLSCMENYVSLTSEQFKTRYMTLEQQADFDNQWKRAYRSLVDSNAMPKFDIKVLSMNLIESLIKIFIDPDKRQHITQVAQDYVNKLVDTTQYFSSGFLHSEKTRVKRKVNKTAVGGMAPLQPVGGMAPLQPPLESKAKPEDKHRYQNMTYFTFPWTLRGLSILGFVLREEKYGDTEMLNLMCKHCSVNPSAVKKERNNLIHIGGFA